MVEWEFWKLNLSGFRTLHFKAQLFYIKIKIYPRKKQQIKLPQRTRRPQQKELNNQLGLPTSDTPLEYFVKY